MQKLQDSTPKITKTKRTGSYDSSDRALAVLGPEFKPGTAKNKN
jgi:hypothetical protein